MAAPELARLEAEVARLREETERLEQESLASDHPATAELAGAALLSAFLDDRPFDRHLFSRRPVKIAFLNAAFDKGDVEVVAAALFFVRQTLTPAAFQDLLNAVPRFRATYDRLSAPRPPVLRMHRDQPVEERLQAARDSLPTASEFMRGVLETHIRRLATQDKAVGVLPIDEKWEELSRVAQSRNYAGFRPDSLLPRFALQSWTTGVDPMQAAIMARRWGMPPEVVQVFAQKAAKAEQEELARRFAK
jgi:hypothetical protein